MRHEDAQHDTTIAMGNAIVNNQSLDSNTAAVDVPSSSSADSTQLRILYLTHYFPPEVNAPAVRVSELAAEWRRLGHQVTVQTCFPNHPRGVIPEQYRGKLYQRSNENGIEVLRSYIFAAPNKGFLKRVMNYVSFMFSTLLLSSWRSGPADIVIGTSPQFFVAIAAWITSLLKRAPFVFEVRDLWPEEIVAVGAIKNKFIIGVLEKIEMFLYRRAKLIVAVAQGTIDTLEGRGIPLQKMVLIPNGVSLGRFSGANGQRVRDKFGMNGEFLVSYIGTHGMAHRLETVLEAAEYLRGDRRVRFMMVGDGAEKENLKRLAEKKRLDNVIFVAETTSNEAPDYYDASDVCLAPLRKASLFQRNIPSKLYEIMAASRPVILGAEGESRRLVEESGAGVAFEPENSAALARRISEMVNNRDSARRMGVRGREYVKTRWQRCDLARKYAQSLAETAHAAVKQ